MPVNAGDSVLRYHVRFTGKEQIRGSYTRNDKHVSAIPTARGYNEMHRVIARRVSVLYVTDNGHIPAEIPARDFDSFQAAFATNARITRKCTFPCAFKNRGQKSSD